MIEEYRTAVQRAYQEKKAAGELSINLTNPTCANLRNECLSRFRAGCYGSDIDILKEFFDIPYSQGISEQAIKRCDPDKFKPLNNFLKKERKTHEKNIEILAWLINFRSRPSTRYYYSPIEHQISAILNNTRYNNTEIPLRASTKKTENFENSIDHIGIGKEGKVLLGMDRPNPIATVYGLSQYSNNYGSRLTNDLADDLDFFHGKRELKKEVTIEYPSGAKLSVDASDIALIAQLVRL